MSFEKEMYEVAEKWDEEYFTPDNKIRIEFIHKLIPSECKSILDVGCGNGILTNYLNDNFSNDFIRICGTDRSETSLKMVKGEKVQSDITSLPFKDNEFEIVTCLEVIEHLPQKVYAQALKEIERIAEKYVIISVPFNENLDFTKITCTKCRTEFNPFYHMHSFSEDRLKNLYNKSSLEFVELHKVENSPIPRMPKLKKWISKKINPNSFPPNCICPMCGYNEMSKLKTQKVVMTSKNSSQGLSKFWPHKSQAKWIAAMFKK